MRGKPKENAYEIRHSTKAIDASQCLRGLEKFKVRKTARRPGSLESDRPVEADRANRWGPRWTVSARRAGDQQLADLSRGPRPAEPPALPEVAADRGEPAFLRRGFNALG